MAEQPLKERMDFILGEFQIRKKKGLAGCQWEVNIIMTSQLLLLKKKERKKKKGKVMRFFHSASKKNMHKGNIFMPDRRSHNQSKTVLPNSCQEIQKSQLGRL